MAFVRPVVEIFQRLTTVTVAPATPDLNCLVVGPAYWIQDYPTDSADIGVGDFVKATYDKDAPSDDIDGTSEGRPASSASFLVLADPPNHTAGGVLDADSVDVVLDDALLQLESGIDGAMVVDTNVFTSAGADFVATKVAVGDRIVLTHTTYDPDPENDMHSIVKTVREVVDETTLNLASTNKNVGEEIIGVADIRYRVEHELVDQHIDDSYVVVVDNEITIKTLANGIQLSYEDTLWTVNFGTLYVGYRELRTDLQEIQEVTAANLVSVLGRDDERNPLAVGVKVALANTNTAIQVFGVEADTALAHQEARDKISTRDDVYAIVPLTNGGLTKANWLSVVTMWKAHCADFAVNKSKFRITLGSYEDLPVDKSSCDPSLVGHTESDPLNPTLFDVFVDPHADTDFVTAAIGATHLLDVARSAGIGTLIAGETIFKEAYAAKELTGVIGGKRLRLAATATEVAAQDADYAVRTAIIESEGGVPRDKVLSGLAASDAGGLLKLTGTAGDFSNSLEGDIAALSVTIVHPTDGHRIEEVSGTGDYIILDTAYVNVDLAAQVRVYRPSDVGGFEVEAAVLSEADRKITLADAFTNAAVGDIALILSSTTPADIGLWIVSAVAADGSYITLGGTGVLVDDGDVNVVIYHPAAARGGAAITTRVRLTRLRDNTASFTTTVIPGEDIEIPYPTSAGEAFEWDTVTTKWEIDTVVSDEILDALLGELEELAPEDFIAGFDGDCPYRISIDLNKASQVTELNLLIEPMQHSRLVMAWPNEVLVSGTENALTEVQNRQAGQYLACAIGGMIAGLPSHQGLTYIGIAGIQRIYNSNMYFSDDQLTALRNGGWYVFVQDSEAGLPYTIHEVTTDVSAYELGELMAIKNFDYVALFYKAILERFPGRYNINTETLQTIRGSLNAGTKYLKLRKFPKIGAPLLDAVVTLLQQDLLEADHLHVYMELDLPKVLNWLGLYLRA